MITLVNENTDIAKYQTAIMEYILVKIQYFLNNFYNKIQSIIELFLQNLANTLPSFFKLNSTAHLFVIFLGQN